MRGKLYNVIWVYSLTDTCIPLRPMKRTFIRSVVEPFGGAMPELLSVADSKRDRSGNILRACPPHR